MGAQCEENRKKVRSYARPDKFLKPVSLPYTSSLSEKAVFSDFGSFLE
jgi:hypothetical protein